MISANIERDYPLMDKQTESFLIFTDHAEYAYISRLFNTLNSVRASLDLRNFNLEQIEDFTFLARRSCQLAISTGWQFSELIYFLKENFNFKTNSDHLYLGAEGLFPSRETYLKWQQLYGLLKPLN